MSSKVAATFYYDIISPFAYFYIKQRQRLESQLDITPVLGGIYPLEKWEEAFEAMHSGKILKAVLKP